MGKIKFIALFGAAFSILFVAYSAYLFVKKDEQKNIESPLPEFLTNAFPSVLGIDLWKPKLNEAPYQKSIDLSAASAISYDITQDKMLYAKNIKAKLPIASLTKIMTAIVAMENGNLTDKITISKSASEIGENSMGLTYGEVLRLEDLLYGLILLSGNDAAEAIAEGSRFGRENFVYLMNKKAEDLGLSDTHFTNPSGLEGDGKQYSTVSDLLIFAEYALKNPAFGKIVSTVEHEIPYSSDHKYFYMFNETNLLTSYPGVKGIKTGYTFEAGLCLVTYLEYQGHKIIAVILNAQNRRQEMKDLLDYSLRLLNVTPPPHL